MKANKKSFEFKYDFYEDNPEDVIFEELEFPSEKSIRFNVTFSEDVRWTNIIRQFASFLDSTGYVGVSDAIDKFIEEKDARMFGLLNKEDDEDTSNPGLSD